MARESAYSGQKITWDQMMASQLDLFAAQRGGVDNAVDAVRHRFGKLALRRASSLQ